MISRIRSGGQTGVDQAALRAAKQRNVATGGVMPNGFRTLAGPHPEFATPEWYSMTEHRSPEWSTRTFANVFAADMTVRIFESSSTPGERLTLLACVGARKKRPWYEMVDVPVRRNPGGGWTMDQDRIFAAVEAIERTRDRLGRDVEVNVAGNTECTAPGIGRFAEVVVTMIIDGTF